MTNEELDDLYLGRTKDIQRSTEKLVNAFPNDPNVGWLCAIAGTLQMISGILVEGVKRMEQEKCPHTEGFSKEKGSLK